MRVTMGDTWSSVYLCQDLICRIRWLWNFRRLIPRFNRRTKISNYACGQIQSELHRRNRRSVRSSRSSSVSIEFAVIPLRTLSIALNLLHREFFVSQNCNILSVLSIFKCSPYKANDKFIISITVYKYISITVLRQCLLLLYNSKFIISIISLLLHNNFYPAIPYRRVQKEKKATSCRVRSLVMVRETSCQRSKGLKTITELRLKLIVNKSSFTARGV